MYFYSTALTLALTKQLQPSDFTHTSRPERPVELGEKQLPLVIKAYWQAQAAARQLPAVRFCQAPREWNRLADGLAAQASVPWPILKQALAERFTE